MTDGQITFLVLVALIIYEASRWIPVRTLVFQPDGHRFWKFSPPLEQLRSRGGGISLLNPLPPHRIHLNALPFPFAPHEEGLAVWNDESGLLTHIAWNQILPKAEGCKLHLTSHLRIRFLNSAQAEQWAKRLQRWQSLSHDQRCDDYAKLCGSAFDLDAIRSHTTKLERNTRTLRRMSDLIFAWILAVIPLVYWLLGDHLYSFLAFAVLPCLTITQAVLLWRTLKCHHPELINDSFPHLLGTAFYPPTAIRVSDWICLSSSTEFHPLAVMLALPPRSPELFQHQASLTWRKTRWPVGTTTLQLPSNRPEVTALETFFDRHHIAINSLESPPIHLHGGESYCPRCHSIYQGNRDIPFCHDCKGVPLITDKVDVT